MSGLRVISFDCGVINTGCVMIDMNKKTNHFEIVSIDLIQTCKEQNMLDEIKKYIKTFIKPQVRHDGLGTVVILEYIFETYRNWNIIRIHKYIRSYFSSMHNVKVVCLRPSQKSVIGGTNTKRKDVSENTARNILDTCGCSAITDKYNSYKRKHDIADALLASVYYYEHM